MIKGRDFSQPQKRYTPYYSSSLESLNIRQTIYQYKALWISYNLIFQNLA